MNCLRFENLLKIIGVLTLAFVLPACSAVKLLYNQAPELAWWYLTDYVDFTEPQRPAVRAGLAHLHSWHRQHQLPGYAETLQRWQPVLLRDVSPAQTCALYTDVMGLVTGLAELSLQAPTDALTVLARLSPAQLAGMERSFAKSNQKYRADYLQGSPQALRDKRFKQALANTEKLYGDLDERQQAVLQSGLDRANFDGEAAYARRLSRQQDMLQTLRQLSTQAVPVEQARTTLNAVMLRAFRSFDPAQRQDVATREQSCQLMADVHNSTNAAQRRNAVDTLARYAGDARLLARGL